MYVIPLIVIILLGLVAVAWNPIFALIVFAVFFVVYLAWVGMSRRTDEKVGTPESRAAAQGRHEEAETRIR